MPKLNTYIIGIGSNLGDRMAYLDEAARLASGRGLNLVQRSSIYETQPLGAADQLFLNGAWLVDTSLGPEHTLAALMEIESRLGRERITRWGNRTVDLDILLWQTEDGGAGVTHGHPELPHPRLLDRDFALLPAAELRPHWQHPISGLTLAEECSRRGYRLSSWSTAPS